MADVNESTTTPVATRCGRCQSALSESERVTAGDRVFCRTCYDILKLQLRTGVNEALAQRGEAWRVGFPPPSVNVFYQVIAANFGIMKFVFLGIIVYEAWFIPRPIKLAEP